jgi:1-acyl-sn-glycerol-3-phosphate acyltransferase
MTQTARPSITYLIIGGLSYPIMRLLFRLRATGRENLPADGGFVLSANHCSNLDPWPLSIPLFPGRYLRFMAKSELFWFPLGILIRGGGGFKVRRGERDHAAIEKAIDLAKRGQVIAMFPEGTRRSKGIRKKWEAKWHSGAARIALEADVPLVPAAISGTDRLARLGPFRVVYGRPIPLDDLRGMDIEEAQHVATQRLKEEITALEALLA